jgi:hypothetical protein
MSLGALLSFLVALEADPATFPCPRCGREVTDRFYGPCDPCRGELRRTMRSEPAAPAAAPARFEPKMNVVPNQVATKE